MNPEQKKILSTQGMKSTIINLCNLLLEQESKSKLLLKDFCFLAQLVKTTITEDLSRLLYLRPHF